MLFFRFLSLCFFVFLFFASPVYSKVIGTVGKTYPIAEPDALAEIEASAGKINMAEMVKQARDKAGNFKPDNPVSLVQAGKNSTFKVQMSYTLEFDIPDGKGGVLYPKGYSFNPLDYVTYPGILVVIDGTVKEQVEWFKQSAYVNDIRAKLLITNGQYYDLAMELKRPVYFLTPEIAKAFNLQAVPCVVMQNGKFMEVREFYVSLSKNSLLH
jgi:conjugal transfer pilus assembly protein TraW